MPREAEDVSEIKLPTATSRELLEVSAPRPDRVGTRLLAAHTPVEVYRAIRTLAAENDRTIAEELHEAWRHHLVAEGKPVPPILDIVLEEFRRYRGRRGRRRG